MGVPKVVADLRLRCPQRAVVGILAFEAASAMSRLVSLHRSLAEDEVRRLRADMRSPGVAYLTSKDQIFLLRLACAEIVGDLDLAAAAVSRLAPRCRDPLLRSFDRFYANLKAGGVFSFLIDARAAADLDRLGLGSTAKRTEKRVRRMERYVAATSRLYAEMEALNELEAEEKRTQKQWRRHSGPILVQKPMPVPDSVHFKLRSHEHMIRRLKEESLWNKTFDKVVELMLRAVITVFARICSVFGLYVLGLPSSGQFNPNNPCKHSSGPLERRVVPQHLPFLRNSSPILSTPPGIGAQETPFDRLRKFLKESPTTVGGSGLALRYANVILAAEKFYQERNRVASAAAEQSERDELYEMLPSGMRAAVRTKLRECWRREGAGFPAAGDGSLAEGWKEAVAAILEWLAPVAHDTVRWQEQRSMEREQQLCTRPRTLMLQTLHFADGDKTEAAVVEVLVGLSCMSWTVPRRSDRFGIWRLCFHFWFVLELKIGSLSLFSIDFMPSSWAATPSYWCYRCSRFVRVRREDVIVCPDCDGGFLEEVSSPPPRIPPAGSPGRRQIPSPGLGTDGSVTAPPPSRTSQLRFRRNRHGSAGDRSSPFNPVIVLRSPSQGGHDEEGAAAASNSFELYYDDGSGSGLRPLPESISDFLMGSGFDRLLQQLAQIEINGTGRERPWEHPPASKAAIESMPTVQIVDDHIGKDCHCAICMDPFKLGAEAREMPCKHIYHQDCILPWLSMRNSCPVCRHEMPADELDEQPEISGNDEETVGLTIWRLPGGGFAVGRFAGGRRAGDHEFPLVYTEMDGGFTNDGAPRRISWTSRRSTPRESGGIFRSLRNFLSFFRPSRPSSEASPASSGDVILAGTNETNDASNWISVTATEEPRDDGSEDPEESHPDSNSVSEGYDTSHTTMTLDLDLAEESSERMNLNSPSTPSLKNIDPNDLDSFATLNVEDAKQLESVYRGIERQLPEPEDDAGIEDFFIYSNDVAPHAFIVSSQRLLDGQVIVQSLELDWVVDISSMAGGEIHRGEIYRLWLWWRRRWGAERRRATVIWLLAAAFVVLLLAAGSRVGDNALSEPAVHPSSAPALVELTLVHDAEAKGALCLDGSPAAYHLTKGFGSGSDKWIVHLEVVTVVATLLGLERGFSDSIFGMFVVFATLIIVRCSVAYICCLQTGDLEGIEKYRKRTVKLFAKVTRRHGYFSFWGTEVLEELRLTMDQFIDLCILSDVIIVISLKYDNACVVEYGASAATVPCLCYLDLI
ncbi:hypothetical protein ZIOFF_059029 [Zingiber officinale]|uniref:RING-type E3 ubiquitin transferase n=1 Tax=Zingiber officinale TaxID=94328 RepID=A0A8J5F9N0_ZINOF|nr:hypothetical protein ZIOFF_059029 [Zingiber officinale]